MRRSPGSSRHYRTETCFGRGAASPISLPCVTGIRSATMWNIERALGIALLASSGVIAFSIASLPFWEEFTLGPGAAPAIYLAGLAICALGLVVRPSPASVGSIGAMI